MYRINIQIITAPDFIIEHATITAIVNAANTVLKNNQVAFYLTFNPQTDYRQVSNGQLVLQDSDASTIDPNGYVLYPGETARYKFAKDYPDKLVFFCHQDFGRTSGGHSWFEMENHVYFYIDKTNPFTGIVGGFLHELGHHLHLFHTFGGLYVNLSDEERNSRTYQQCLDEVKKRMAENIKLYVEKENHTKEEGLQVFNGDGLADTKLDAGDDIIIYTTAVNANKGGQDAKNLAADFGPGQLNFGATNDITVDIPVTFKDGTTKTYKYSTDTTNIMSYFQACDNVKTISPTQRTNMLNSLVDKNRHYLLHMCGIKWPTGKIYFFKGPKYIRYDVATKTVDPGYPKITKTVWLNWPANWESPDAAFLWPGQKKAVFIKDAECIDFDIAANKFIGTPKPVAQQFAGWPADWKFIDAALVVSHSVFLFKGADYMVYSLQENKMVVGMHKIKDKFDFFWKSDFDCIIGNNEMSRLTVFKGSKFIEYDLANKKLISEKPVSIRGNWPGIGKDFTSAYAKWDGQFNFCRGNKIIGYDTVLSDTSGKIQSLSDIKLPSQWVTIDAEFVLSTGSNSDNTGLAATIAVFYCNDEMVLYDIKNKKSFSGNNGFKIKEFYPNWPVAIHQKVFAALKWPDDKVFLFVSNGSEMQYLVQDVKTPAIINKLDATPKSITGFFKNWPTSFLWAHTLNIKAVLANWREGTNGCIYFFCGDEYIKYDVATNTVLPGYPLKIGQCGQKWCFFNWSNIQSLKVLSEEEASSAEEQLASNSLTHILKMKWRH